MYINLFANTQKAVVKHLIVSHILAQQTELAHLLELNVLLFEIFGLSRKTARSIKTAIRYLMSDDLDNFFMVILTQ